MIQRPGRAADHTVAGWPALVALAALALHSMSADAAVSVELDLSQAEKVFAVIDAGTLDAGQLRYFRADPVTAAVIRHGSKFDKRVTLSAWEAGLTAAAAKRPLPQDPPAAAAATRCGGTARAGRAHADQRTRRRDGDTRRAFR